VQSLFRFLLRVTLARPALVLLLSLISILASLYLTATRLEFSTDRTQLLDPDHPIQKGYRDFREEFGGSADLVVLVSGQPVQVRQTVDQLGQALKADPSFKDVLFRLDVPELTRHSLYYLSYPDLRNLQRQASALESWWPAQPGRAPDLFETLESHSDQQIQQLLEPVTSILAAALEGALQSFKTRGEGPYLSPIPVLLPESERLAGTTFKPGQTTFYNTVGHEGACMVIARPADPSGSFSADSLTIARLRQIVRRVSLDHPAVNCLVSGEPVINTDEMVGARNDAVKCSLTALVLVSLLLVLAFGNLLRPLCAVVALLVGLCWSFAFAALSVGTLNLLTVHFATILSGLCMTFAIQLLAHYQDMRSRPGETRAPREVLEVAVSETGLQTFIGALATAVAFWTLHFTNFRAAGELGLITGTGVLLTFAAIWILFPVLVHLAEGDRPVQAMRIPGFATLGRWLNARPGAVLLASLAITAYSLTWINRVPFNYDLLSMQAKGSDSVEVEHLLQTLGYSSLYAVVTAHSLEEVSALTTRLQSLPTVSHVESVASLLPRDVQRKRQAVEAILRAVKHISSAPFPRIDDFMQSGQRYRSARQLLRLRDHFQAQAGRLRAILLRLPRSKDQQRLLAAFDKLKELLGGNSPGPLEAGLRSYEKRLYDELESYREFLLRQEASPPDVLAAMPAELRSRSVSSKGNYALRIFPRADIWQREPMGKFVHQLEAVAPKVTGTPLLIYYYLEELRLAYSSAGRNALLVIAVLLLIYYRSPLQAGLALFPKLLGVIWMIGLMGLGGVSFNAANFLALPITLGIGLVFGVNILSQCRQNGVEGLFASATGSGVLLSGLVATLGFASFALANHLGVASFGYVMAAGVGANMVTSLGTLPALLAFWDKRRATASASAP
jgi:hopanoid biosynthesis associated RND transporter like protein HpnN